MGPYKYRNHPYAKKLMSASPRGLLNACAEGGEPLAAEKWFDEGVALPA